MSETGQIINLTGEVITIVDPEGKELATYLPIDTVASICILSSDRGRRVNGLKVEEIISVVPLSLTGPQEERFYIVKAEVAQAIKMVGQRITTDLLIPEGPVQDRTGRQIGYLRLTYFK